MAITSVGYCELFLPTEEFQEARWILPETVCQGRCLVREIIELFRKQVLLA